LRTYDENTKTHLDLDSVQEAGRAAHQRAAGEGELGDRVVAALVQHARAVRDALAALELLGHRGVVLPALRESNRAVVVKSCAVSSSPPTTK
jgi:hypothetical protein